MKTKLILKKCKCSKTISKFNGDLEKRLCFTCIEKEVNEHTRLRNFKEYMGNNKKKVTKPKKIDPSIIKLAKLGE